MHTRWTDGELEMIRRMWAEGHSGSHIANTLGEAGFHRSRNAVIGIVHRQGWASHRPKPVKVAKSSEEILVVAEERRATKVVVKRERAPAAVVRRPPPSRRPLEAPEPEPAVSPQPRPLPPEGGVALVDLEHWHCRYVVVESPYRFCGQEKAFGTSWCSVCCERVFTPEGMERMRVARKPPQRVKAAA